MSKIEELAAAVTKGKAKLVPNLVKDCLAEGIDPVEILNKGMIGAMDIVGEKFKNNEIFVPEMLVAARAMKKGVEVLKPSLAGGDNISLGKYVIGTVAGDLHDIGKNLVAMMIESSGFEVIDLGVDVPKEKFVEAVKNDPEVKIVGLSALLTTTMPAMKDTVEALIEAGCKSQVKIMVGGAPITQEFADEIGAFCAQKKPQQRNRQQTQRLQRHARVQQACHAVQHNAQRVFHKENHADIRSERFCVLGHASDIRPQQRTHAEQAAQHAGQKADDRQQDFAFLYLLRLPLAQKHLCAQQHDHCAENQLHSARIRIFQQQHARNAAQHHQRRQRQAEPGINRFSLPVCDHSVAGITQQQFHRRDIPVADAKAHHRGKHQRIGKATQALHIKRAQRRDDPPDHDPLLLDVLMRTL